MALRLALAAAGNPIGVEFPAAYARIERAVITRLGDTVPKHMLDLNVYFYATEPTERMQSVTQRQYSVPLPELPLDSSLQAAAYAYLATHPDFDGAVPA